MGYFQVLINSEHAKYTSFIIHIGKFEYTRKPQGLVKSQSTFARLMVEIFGKIKSLLQYFDDLWGSFKTRIHVKVICTSYSNGRQHDFRLYKESKVKIHPEIHVLTDSSYQGLQKLHLNKKMPKKKTKKILSLK
ncbi:hypothetical protein ACTFIW_005458 [Dictyostelium discoideum]